MILIIMPASFAANAQSQIEKHIFTVASKDGLPIIYDISGEGKTALVFVHGWSVDRSYWREQIEYFSEDYKVVNLDLAGHGDSGLGREDYTIYSFGGDVAAVVEKIDLQRVILIGHSMGGDVIADAARQLSGRVIGLVMVDTYKKLGAGREEEQIEGFLNSLRPNFKESVSSFVRDMFLPTSDSTLVDYVVKDMSSAPPAIALSALRSSFYHSRQITHDFEALDLPIVALNPDDTPTDVQSMKNHKVEVVIMPYSGHFLMMEDPQQFNSILKTIVQKLDN